MLAAFGKRLFNALLFAEVPLADELDLHARVRCQFLGVFANAVPERLRKSGIVENPNVSLEQKGGHPSGKTDLRQGSENQHSVPATQYARNLVPVPFRQQLDGHSGIIASLVRFRLRRVRWCPDSSGKFSATSTICRLPCAIQFASKVATPAGLGELRESASHIWIGGGNSRARSFSTSAMFSPACLGPVKKSAMLCAATIETMPLVKMPVRLSLGSRVRRRIRMPVSSLCMTPPCAASQMSACSTGQNTFAAAAISSHCVAAGSGMAN